MTKELEIIGIQMDFGASKRGVSMGPAAIRYGGLCQGLEQLGYTVHDQGDLVPPQTGESLPNLRNKGQVVEANRQLYHAVKQALERGRFPIVLGGDHSVAAGSIAAVSKHYQPQGGVGIIWIDAHGDWNNPDTTPTGNMHGMPFSAVCGRGPDCMADFGQGPAWVDVTRCVQIGGRDIDNQERANMKAAGVTVFPINLVDQLGMHEVIRQAIQVAGRDTAGIHLSFDVDAITPEAAPGTGTVVHSGLTAREAFLAVETLAECSRRIK